MLFATYPNKDIIAIPLPTCTNAKVCVLHSAEDFVLQL